MNRKEVLNDYIKSYSALVEDVENTVNCLGKKQILIDLINGAERSNLWDIWRELDQVGYFVDDVTNLRDFALNVVNNCYDECPTTEDEERNNHNIENAIFNALHKDKEEYFQGLEEALEVHDVLNPSLWEDGVLRSDVADALLNVANTFIDNLGFPINVVDIRIVGSNASYNYNSNSDIDLHIITNFDLNYVDNVILQQLYNDEKNSFNNKHNIFIKGIPVELYVEDVNSINATNGSYSLLNNDWIKYPEPINYEIPDYSSELDLELNKAEEALLSDDSQTIKDEINHIYLMRRDGLATGGEASKGNLVFKELRNLDIIKKLADKFYELESSELSLESEELREFHDFMSLNPQVELDDDDIDTINYWKEQIKKGNHRPILINTNKEILDGNHTMVAYQELGVEPPLVYLGTREDFYKHVANTKRVDALDAINDMIDDGSAVLLEWVNYRDVTVEELNSNKCYFIVIDPESGHMTENEFNNLKEVFTYVKECGGFKDFKDFRWYIKSTYKDGEFYYVRDRFAKGGWHWEDCNGDIVGGFLSKSFRDHLNEVSLKSYPIKSDTVVGLLNDALKDFHWFVEYQQNNKKKLNIITNKSRQEGNDKIIGTVDINNRDRVIYIHYHGKQLDFNIPDSFDKDDSEYESTCRSIDRSLTGFVKEVNSNDKKSKEVIEPEDEVDTFTGIRQDEDGVYYHYQNGVRGEVASDDDLREYQRLNEADLLDILNKAKAETPKRVRRAQSLYSEYTGLDSDGTIMFHTDSQTRSSHGGHDQFIFYEGFFDLLDKVDAGEHITQEDVLEIITGDTMIRCTCEDFLYGGFAYMSWNNGYGLQKELRAPDVRNPDRKGSACKHCLSVLNLINQSDTLFNKISKDLDNLFQRYKKMSKSKPKNESQILTEVSELHGDLDPYDLVDDLFRMQSDIRVLYDEYDKDHSGDRDRDSIVNSLNDIRDFVVNKFGIMGDTTNVTESVGDATPNGIMDSLNSIYKEIDDLYTQEEEVVDDNTKLEHLNAIKKIIGFFTKKFNESKKK